MEDGIGDLKEARAEARGEEPSSLMDSPRKFLVVGDGLLCVRNSKKARVTGSQGMWMGGEFQGSFTHPLMAFVFDPGGKRAGKTW